MSILNPAESVIDGRIMSAIHQYLGTSPVFDWADQWSRKQARSFHPDSQHNRRDALSKLYTVDIQDLLTKITAPKEPGELEAYIEKVQRDVYYGKMQILWIRGGTRMRREFLPNNTVLPANDNKLIARYMERAGSPAKQSVNNALARIVCSPLKTLQNRGEPLLLIFSDISFDLLGHQEFLGRLRAEPAFVGRVIYMRVEFAMKEYSVRSGEAPFLSMNADCVTGVEFEAVAFDGDIEYNVERLYLDKAAPLCPTDQTIFDYLVADPDNIRKRYGQIDYRIWWHWQERYATWADGHLNLADARLPNGLKREMLSAFDSFLLQNWSKHHPKLSFLRPHMISSDWQATGPNPALVNSVTDGFGGAPQGFEGVKRIGQIP